MRHLEKDIVIIGGGPAGMAAALGAVSQARDSGSKSSVLIIERNESLGGILGQCIHDGFGLFKFGTILTGPEYSLRYEEDIRKTDVEVMASSYALKVEDGIVHVNSKNGYFGIKYKAVIFAMGCRERTSFNIGVCGTRPGGVYTAGTVQNLTNLANIKIGSRVVIVGSGDIGLIMARRLTLEGAKVLGVYEILPYPSGLLRNIQQCLTDFGIPMYLKKSVTQIHGDKHIDAVTVTDYDDNQNPLPSSEIIKCDALILAVGLIPETELLPNGIEGYSGTKGPLVNENNMTSLNGFFCCGNVLHVNDLVDWVSTESEYTGRCAYNYISGKNDVDCSIKVAAGSGVSYVTPNAVSGTKDVTFALRIKKPMENGGTIKFVSETGETVFEKYEERMIPSEMLHIKLKKNIIEKTKSIMVMVNE